jgi:ATP-dependent Lhr-like helicase
VERGRIRKLGVEKVNGEPVMGTQWEELLLELGFRAGPRKLSIGA